MTIDFQSSPPNADVDSVLRGLQHEVQRKLGRSMLRLQQFERMLKTMVGSLTVEGAPEQLQAIRDEQLAFFRNKSLGMLVAKFTGSDALATPPEDDAILEEIAGDKESGTARVRVCFSIEMTPECLAQTKADLGELIAMRNDLVHHLIERFDVFDESGCRAASVHLDDCYEKIDGHCGLLNSWATSLTECQALHSSYLQSKSFEDMFVHGINPDGSVCWPQSTIVERLREAETACQVDGWTSLDAAIGFISKENRDHVPKRYGCKTWRQVLRKSGLFELRCPAPEDGAIGRAWYRSRPEVPASL